MQIIINRQEVIACLSGEGYQGEASIVCPNCGSDNSHIIKVGTLEGSDEAEGKGAYEGTNVIGKTDPRRAALEIVFECEQCPQPFSLLIQQHKGVNLLQIRKAD